MDTNEILNNIKKRDFSAYSQLFQKYGWNMYQYLQKHYSDKAAQDAALEEIMTGFYNTLSESEGDDLLEIMLYAYADTVIQKGKSSKSDVPPMPYLKHEESSFPNTWRGSAPGREERSELNGRRDTGVFTFTLVLILLLIGLAFFTWVIVGLLMDMDVIPFIDLGYEWFNQNIAPWF